MSEDGEEEKLICDTCGEEFTQGFILAVIDKRPGDTSFLRHFDTKHWQEHILDVVARVLTDFPHLQKYFDERLEIYKGMQDE